MGFAKVAMQKSRFLSNLCRISHLYIRGVEIGDLQQSIFGARGKDKQGVCETPFRLCSSPNVTGVTGVSNKYRVTRTRVSSRRSPAGPQRRRTYFI